MLYFYGNIVPARVSDVTDFSIFFYFVGAIHILD